MNLGSHWIKEQAVVIAVDQGSASVCVERQSTCSACQVKSACGNGVLASVLGRKKITFTVRNSLDLRPGDRVTLGIRDDALVSGAAVMYLLPLSGMMIPAGFATLKYPDLAEPWLIVLSAVGFILGLLMVRIWMRRRSQQLEPVVLGKVVATSSVSLLS